MTSALGQCGIIYIRMFQQQQQQSLCDNAKWRYHDAGTDPRSCPVDVAQIGHAVGTPIKCLAVMRCSVLSFHFSLFNGSCFINSICFSYTISQSNFHVDPNMGSRSGRRKGPTLHFYYTVILIVCSRVLYRSYFLHMQTTVFGCSGSTLVHWGIHCNTIYQAIFVASRANKSIECCRL